MLGAMSTRLLSRVRRPAVVAVSAALAASLVLAGCGGSDKKEGDETPDAQATEGGTLLPAEWPLTGLPAKKALPKHAVMFVKIDNSSASDPQIGVGSADMVFQQLVEGGYTRLAAAFYSKLPKVAGPVRSARATDIGIVLPTKGTLVASGSAPATVARLKNTGVSYKSYDGSAPGMYRDTSDPQHDYLHSVFVDLKKLSNSVGPVAPPAPYLPWGTEDEFVGTAPAKNVTVRFSPRDGATTTFAFKNGTYVLGGDFMPAGDQFTPTSVLVLRVKSGDAGYRDPAGGFVPESYFYGRGQALLFHNGQVVRGTWSKPVRRSPVALSTVSGELRVPPGKVWVALVPTNEGDPKVTFK